MAGVLPEQIMDEPVQYCNVYLARFQQKWELVVPENKGM
jgi:hypothetical protein